MTTLIPMNTAPLRALFVALAALGIPNLTMMLDGLARKHGLKLRRSH